jgi:hypothetical protein
MPPMDTPWTRAAGSHAAMLQCGDGADVMAAAYTAHPGLL